MNQDFVCGVNQATPITLEVSKNVWNKQNAVVAD